MVKGADRLLALAGLAATRARAELARALADVRAAEAALAEAAARSRTGLPEGGTDAVALRLDTLARLRARAEAEDRLAAVATARAIAETKRRRAARAIGREAALAELVAEERRRAAARRDQLS